jgi:hypothetical protein
MAQLLNQVGFSSIQTIGAALGLLGRHRECDAIIIDKAAFSKPLEMHDNNEELVHAMTKRKRVEVFHYSRDSGTIHMHIYIVHM